jgi:hypothetical protein
MYIVSAKADQDLLYKYLETSREKHK